MRHGGLRATGFRKRMGDAGPTGASVSSDIDIGDAAEPDRCSPADFPAATVTIDGSLWPHVCVVAGGPQYTSAEADWVICRVQHLLLPKRGRNQVHLAVPASQGAASIVYRQFHNARQPATMELLNIGYGRAAPYRLAWRLIAEADSLILFEPLDEIARHLRTLAGLMETRWRKGLPITVIPPRLS
jgi:hypothetical protein